MFEKSRIFTAAEKIASAMNIPISKLFERDRYKNNLYVCRMPPFQTVSLLILWDTIAEYLIMPDRILIYSYTITGVTLNGIDNSVLHFLNDTRMVG